MGTSIARIAQGSIAEKRQLKHGYIEVHRLWCVHAYKDDCPGHVLVEVLNKGGEVVSLQSTKEYSKCSVCRRYIQTKFRYMLVPAVPPDVPRLPNPNAGKSAAEIQILVNRS